MINLPRHYRNLYRAADGMISVGVGLADNMQKGYFEEKRDTLFVPIFLLQGRANF